MAIAVVVLVVDSVSAASLETATLKRIKRRYRHITASRLVLKIRQLG